MFKKLAIMGLVSCLLASQTRAADMYLNPTAGYAIMGDSTASGNVMTIKSTGNVGIGTTEPGAKLEVYNGNFVISDADVAHGMTGYAPTNAFGQFGINSGSAGGLVIEGLSDSGSVEPMILRGSIGASDPTDSIPAVYLIGQKANGTAAQALGATETVFKLTNYSSDLVTVLGSGNVGIGTTGPHHVLEVVGTGGTIKVGAGSGGSYQTGNVVLGDDNTTSMYVGMFRGTLAGAVGSGNVLNLAGYDGINLTTGNAAFGSQTKVMTLTTTGNVGIGTTAPNRMLELSKADGDSYIRVVGGEADVAGIELWADNGDDNADKSILKSDGAGLLFLVNSATEAMKLQTDGDIEIMNGNVGIGTTGPGDIVGGSPILDISGTAPGIRLQDTTAANYDWELIANNGPLHFYAETGSTEVMRLNQDGVIYIPGNVGIGTTGPNAVALLDVSSTTKGFLPPRMTTTERDAISTPPAGLMIYNTTTNKLNFYNGTAWEVVTSGV